MGTMTASAARRTTSRAGTLALAALPSVAEVAVELACSGSPEPIQSRPEPQRRRQHDGGRDERAQARLAQPHEDAVGPEQDPRLGADEPGQRDEHERPVAAPGEVAIGGAERERDEHGLGGAQQGGAVEVGAQGEAERGDRAGQRPGQPGAEPVGEHEREHRGGAHEPHPHDRRRGAEDRQRREGQDRQRLERRAGGGGEVEVGELAPPHRPRPRVVAERGRQRQRRRAGEHGDAERGRPAAARPRHAAQCSSAADMAAGRYHRGAQDDDAGRRPWRSSPSPRRRTTTPDSPHSSIPSSRAAASTPASAFA